MNPLERDCSRQVLQPAHGRLRTQLSPALRQPADRHLEGRIGTQRIAVVAIGIAGGDQQRTETDHLGDAVLYRRLITRIFNAFRQPFGNSKLPLDLRQQQHTGIRSQPAAVERHAHLLAADGWKIELCIGILGHGGCGAACLRARMVSTPNP